MNRYGLIGKHLGHSFSPKLHEIIFKNSGIYGEYNLFEVPKTNLKHTIEMLRSLEIKGFNVTIPYKVESINYLDEVSREASMIGAINTIKYEDNLLKGYNTDYYGFGALLRKEKIEIKNKSAIILGTGGASKSVFHYLNNNGIKQIIFASRNPSKVKEINPQLNTVSYEELNKINSIDIVVNTTPVGMYPNTDKTPINKEMLSKVNAAVDLIYNPMETTFLKLARESGLKAVNGLYMLVAQGIKSQEIWNNVEFDDDLYDIVYSEVLEYVK